MKLQISINYFLQFNLNIWFHFLGRVLHIFDTFDVPLVFLKTYNIYGTNDMNHKLQHCHFQICNCAWIQFLSNMQHKIIIETCCISCILDRECPTTENAKKLRSMILVFIYTFSYELRQLATNQKLPKNSSKFKTNVYISYNDNRIGIFKLPSILYFNVRTKTHSKVPDQTRLFQKYFVFLTEFRDYHYNIGFFFYFIG